MEEKKLFGNFAGMPAGLKLDLFGQIILDVFGNVPYLVGSATTSKTWRDVDVRLILWDDEFQDMNLGDPKYPGSNVKWAGICMAFSALGKELTGLPIDFQIQSMTDANRRFKSEDGHIRFGLFQKPMRPREEPEYQI